MKVLVLFGFLAVVLLQTDARSIGLQSGEMPKAIKDIMEQSFSCGMELGPSKLKNLPNVAGLTHYPEDNDSLNALWGCIFKKKGIVNENSEINQDNLELYLHDIADMVGKTSSSTRQSLDDMAEECSNVHGNDYGQTAVKIQNCAMRYSQDRNLRK